MSLTKGDFILRESVSTLQASRIKRNKRVELTDGTRYLTSATDGGEGVLLANGNYANPIDTVNEEFIGKVELHGLEPERLSATQLRIFPGYCSDGASQPTVRMEILTPVTIELTNNGLNGLDTGTITDGVEYFVYMVKNVATGVVGAVVSGEMSLGAVTMPPGFTRARKLPFGFIYNIPQAFPQGIPNFHLSAWPLPQIVYTDTDDQSGAWTVLTDGASSTLTSFNLDSVIPDNARMAYLLCKTVSTGTAGDAFLRVSGSGGNGIPVGSVSATVGDTSYMTIKKRITSGGNCSYKTQSGVELTVIVLGYDMTERA